MLSFSYYLHEKADESRHNEAMGTLIAVVGSVFMMGGIIQTLVTVQRPDWFLIFPYQTSSSPNGFLGFGFMLLGIMIFVSGIALAIYYGAQRSWYGNALKEAYRFEEEKLRAQKKMEKNSFPQVAPQAASDSIPYPDIPDLNPNVEQATKSQTR